MTQAACAHNPAPTDKRLRGEYTHAMKEELLQSAIEQGVSVNLLFEHEKPSFGDLFLIRGFDHPKSPSSGRFDFSALSHFEFDQVDDYFGIQSDEDDDGDDVSIWLYPLVKRRPVSHHAGPFDGLRLSYSVLRNPALRGKLFLEIISGFASHLPARVVYTLRNEDLGNPPNLTILDEDINQVIASLREQGIEPGSKEAMAVDF